MAMDKELPNNQGNHNPTSPNPASTQFFHTVELLGMALSHLPPLQILLLQRTSKFFLGAIETSTLIQRKLFFEPDPQITDFQNIEANPFLFCFNTPWHRLTVSMSGIEPWGCYGQIAIADMRRWGHPSASWRRMLVSMPAVKEVIVSRYDTAIHWGRSGSFYAGGGEGGGVRMGQIADYGWGDKGSLKGLLWLRLEG